MKKIIISLLFALLFCITLAFAVSAETVYLQEIPAELKTGETDTATHFIVIEEGKYFNLNNTQIRTLNADNIAADIAAAGIDASLIGTKYLTRFNFPAQIGDVTVSEVYFETIKQDKTYYHSKVGYVQLEPSVIPTGNMNDTTAQLRCFDFGEGNISTTIPGHLCNGASRMKIVKNFPQNVTTIGGSAFGSCNLAIFEDLKIENITSLTLNFSNLEYISSAGLRVLIATQKKMNEKDIPMVITNVNNTIKEIFRMSGFDKILEIK
jgi:ABC-type transporter Mla MlaB component